MSTDDLFGPVELLALVKEHGIEGARDVMDGVMEIDSLVARLEAVASSEGIEDEGEVMALCEEAAAFIIEMAKALAAKK